MITKNISPLTLIGVIIVLAAIIGMMIRGCNDRSKPVVSSFTQIQMDSVLKRYEESDRLLTELIRKSNQQSITIDSSKEAAKITSDSLERQTLKLRVAYKDVQIARSKIKEMEDGGDDFINFINRCDSLAEEADRQANLTNQFQKQSRELQSSFDSLLSNNSLRIARLEFDRDFNKEKFDTLAQYTLALEKSKGIADKKAKKRVGIGPSGGVTYYSNKVQPYVGIGVHYSIIRL